MFDATVNSVLQLMSIWGLVAFLVMIPIALISGSLPGGGLPVTVVVLSVAIHLDPMVAIILMLTSPRGQGLTDHFLGTVMLNRRV